MANTDFSALVHSPIDLRDELLAFAEEAKYPGIPFGVPVIDRHVIPIRPGNFVALIGRPGSAKSSVCAYLARQEAKRIVERGKQLEEAVVYVTWESSAEELEAFFQADDKVSVSDIAWGRADLEYMREKAQSRANLPIWVIGHGIGRAGKKAPRMTIEAVLGGIRTMEDEYHVKPRLLIFDYVQLMPVPSAKERVEQVSEAAILIKELAGQLAVPAIAAVQARQEVDRSASKIPGMDDGQWSSSITQTADKAFALMRPIVAFPGAKRIKLDWLDGKEVEITDTLLILRLLKQRMEKAGLTWALHFDPRYLVLAEKELRQQEDWK